MNTFRITKNFEWATMRFSTSMDLKYLMDYFNLVVTDQNSPILKVDNNFRDNFKTLLVSSFIIQLYSYFEHTLNEICKAYELKYETNSIDKYKDRNYLKNRLDFIQDKTGYNLSGNNYEVEIDFFQTLRNKLVHNNGEFSEGSKLLNLNYKLNKFGWGAFENMENKVKNYEISSLGDTVFKEAYNAVNLMLMDIYRSLELKELSHN